MKKTKVVVTNVFDAASGMLSNPYEIQVNKRHMTAPAQDLTIPEILERFSRGVLPPIAKDPLFDDTDNFEANVSYRTPGFDIIDATEELRAIENRKKSRAKVDAKPKDPIASSVAEGGGLQAEATPKPDDSLQSGAKE